MKRLIIGLILIMCLLVPVSCTSDDEGIAIKGSLRF